MSDHLSFSLTWLHQLKIGTSDKDISQKGEEDGSVNPPGDVFLFRDVLHHLGKQNSDGQSSYRRPPAKVTATGAAELDPAVKATKTWLEPLLLL